MTDSPGNCGKTCLTDLDRRYVWHPFTQMKEWAQSEPVIITEGRDCFLKDINGRWYLDGVSSLWVNIHGHRRREVDDAVAAQTGRIAHSTLLGLCNVPSILLAERLIRLTDASFKGLSPRLSKVFFSDNGSTAVEVALKMSFQYWQHRGKETKRLFLSLSNGYHGDTLGAVSVGGIDIFHHTFRPILIDTVKAPSPFCYRCELSRVHPECSLACLSVLEDIIRSRCNDLAAFIVEPIVQAAGGMVVFPEGYLAGAREICSRYGVLLIADEVATGFGRTGRMFACEHESVVPDLLCLSKGITNGYLPLAATLTTEEIYAAFLGEFKDLKTFFHGHSYTGNPVACAAALASLDLFGQDDTLNKLVAKTSLLNRFSEEISGLPHVGDVRARGLMAGIELVRDKTTKEPYTWEEKIGWKVTYKARTEGVLLRPLGNVIVIMPPLSISLDNLQALLRVVRRSISAVTDDN